MKKSGKKGGVFARLGILAKLVILILAVIASFTVVFVVVKDSVSRLAKASEEIQLLQGGLVRRTTNLQGRAYDRLQGTARMVRDRSRYAMDASRGAVEQKPLTYVAVAFLAGVVLASFFEWKKTS